MTLTRQQKRLLCELARDAWAECPHREALLAANPEHGPSAVQEGWRRGEQAQALGDGRDSLTEASQSDYPRLMAHFWGQRAAWARGPAQAAAQRQHAYWVGRSATDAARRARHCLDRELRAAQLPLAYAEAICRTQNGCAVAQASEAQIWRLVFTIRNRRKRV